MSPYKEVKFSEVGINQVFMAHGLFFSKIDECRYIRIGHGGAFALSVEERNTAKVWVEQ